MKTEPAPVLFDRKSIPKGDWPFLRTIENSLDRIRESLHSEIDVSEGLGAFTISGQIECYRQLVLRRVIELTESVRLLWSDKLDVGAMICARALFETIVSYHDFYAKAVKLEAGKDYQALGQLVDQFVLSTRDETIRVKLDLPQTTNILTQVKRFAQLVEPKAEVFYAQISDVSHPNGYAMVRQYGSLQDLTFRFQKDVEREQAFQAIYNCIYLICWFYVSMDDLDRLLDGIRYLSPPTKS